MFGMVHMRQVRSCSFQIAVQHMCNMYVLFYKSMSAVHLCELTGSFREMAASHLAEVGGVLSEHGQELDHGWQNTFWRCVSFLLLLPSHLRSKT